MTDIRWLQDLEPREAKETYRQDRQHEITEGTLPAHGDRLERFMDWCDPHEVTNMNELTGREFTARNSMEART